MPIDTFRKKKCQYLVYRCGGDCDRALCTYVVANLRKLHIDIQRWHSVEGHCCVRECNESRSIFGRSLNNANALQHFLFCDRIREYKFLEDETHLPLNHLARLERPLTMKKDQSSKTGQNPWLLTAKESARVEMFL